jgi:chorismate synthase
MPAGVGEPYFDSFESVISHMMFSVPGVKGVLFGAGIDFAKMRGSMANDAFRMDENGNVYTKTNNNGGVNGGITNGSPICFTTVIKPTPSIYKQQETIDFVAKEEKDISIEGRHDPCIAHRARIVIDSLTAIALCDMLSCRYGTDFLA